MQFTDNDLYFYKANYISNYDGDTVRMDIDLGMGVWLRNQSLRLARINTPEIRGDDEDMKRKAKAAKDILKTWLLNGGQLYVRTFKPGSDKYGRWIVDIYTQKGTCINDTLVSNGYAEYVNY